MSRRSARLNIRRRWRHSRHVFGQPRPLPRVPLPVLAVAVLLTIAVLALQGTDGEGSDKVVAGVAPQLAAFSVTAQELEIDRAQAAEVPLAAGALAGVSHVASTSPTSAVATSAAAATTAATVAVRATSAPTTAKPVATTKAPSTTAATTTAAPTTTAAAATTAAPTTAASPGDGAPAGAIPLGEFTVVCYVIVGTTYSGEPTGPNVVAVDKNVIPLHTNLWIAGGVGHRTALDIGGGVKGKVLDLWMTWPDCKKFGKQRLNVYQLP